MNRSTRTVGVVLIAAGLVLVAGVGVNFALANRAGTHSSCVERTDPPYNVDLLEAGEGTEVHTTYSLVPAGINCAYALTERGTFATVFLDLGTFQGALGAGLGIIGAAVLLDGTRRERLVNG